MSHVLYVFFFFFNDPAPTEIYPLSLHDALPILPSAANEQRRKEEPPGQRTLHRSPFPVHALLGHRQATATPRGLSACSGLLTRSADHQPLSIASSSAIYAWGRPQYRAPSVMRRLYSAFGMCSRSDFALTT